MSGGEHTPHHGIGAEMPRQNSETRAGPDRIFFVVLLVFMILISAILTLAGFLNNLSVGNCTAEMPCHAYLTGLSDAINPLVALLTLIGVLVLARRVREHQNPTWWIPLAGLLIVTAAFFVSTVLNAAGVNVNPFGA